MPKRNKDFRAISDVNSRQFDNKEYQPNSYSEFIKALFIMDIQKQNSKKIGKLKYFEFVKDWNSIENQLQDSTFWSFICDNDYYNNLETRIDLVIDLANQVTKVETEEQRKSSFYRYEKLFQHNARLEWKPIKKTFHKLKEWYTDKELFHYIGFLIVGKYERLANLVLLSKGQTKEAFKKLLLEVIQHNFSKTSLFKKNTIHKKPAVRKPL